MKTSDVLKHVMTKREITMQQLAEQSGVPIETIRNIYYNKICDPKSSTILKLSLALDLSMNYLMGDLHYKDDEKELLANYRAASDRGKAVIRLFAKVERSMTDQERSADNKYVIPCLIPIGNVTDGIAYHSCDSVKIETDNADAYLAIEITTNNFAPAYCTGDRILLANRFPNDGERAVFLHNGTAYFRQYVKHDDHYRLRCIHGRGTDMIFDRMDQIDCIGTLIGIIRS